MEDYASSLLPQRQERKDKVSARCRSSQRKDSRPSLARAKQPTGDRRHDQEGHDEGENDCVAANPWRDEESDRAGKPDP